MSPKLTQLLDEMTPQERAEVEAFAAFVMVRRHLQRPQLLTDDISVQELTELLAASGSFDWLNAEEEDIYSLEGGEALQWPSPCQAPGCQTRDLESREKHSRRRRRPLARRSSQRAGCKEPAPT